MSLLLLSSFLPVKWGDSTAEFDWEIALRYVDKDTNGIFASPVCSSFFFFFQNQLKKSLLFRLYFSEVLKYLFIWLHRVLVAACRILNLHCDIQDL